MKNPSSLCKIVLHPGGGRSGAIWVCQLGGDMTLYRVTEIRYELAEEDELPEGRLVHITEAAGVARVQLHKDHVFTPLLCEHFNEHSRPMHEYGRWAQDWDDTADTVRAEQPAGGANLARAWWEFRPPQEMPEGAVCFPIERPGEIFWVIREGAISHELLAEMNAHLERIVGDGLWRQQGWGG